MKSFQRGLTLLEVLIALSIFSMIGVASYRVLSTVITTEEISAKHSQQLSQLQRTFLIVDRDLQQLVKRDIRIKEQLSTQREGAYLEVNHSDYPLEFSRAGYSNPLLLPRSALQRVAYDVGLHPQVANVESRYYGDRRPYLRRHIWTVLDRNNDSVMITQALLADVADFTASVITDKGKALSWPPSKNQAAQRVVNNNSSDTSNTNDAVIQAIELNLIFSNETQLARVYKVM